MLAVITDDFTGAAEIAGIALSKGFTSTIETGEVRPTASDILVLAANTRSLDADMAKARTSDLAGALLSLAPDMIFKKVDSVLRGHIGPELAAIMQAEGKSRALLVPANPSLGRTIVNGIYYLSDIPISATGFATGGNVCARTSRVDEILVSRGSALPTCLSVDQYAGQDGLIVGNAATVADVAAWAARVNGTMVPAGAADFFKAILDQRNPATSAMPAAAPFGRRALFICGSKFPSSGIAVNAARDNGHAVLEMPDAIYHDSDHDKALVSAWADEVSKAVLAGEGAIISALQTESAHSLTGQHLAQVLAEVAALVVERTGLEELMVEGGATAEAVMARLEIHTLHPVQSLAPGVTRMRAGETDGLHVTMKPGSYRWPDTVWPFNKRKGESE